MIVDRNGVVMSLLFYSWLFLNGFGNPQLEENIPMWISALNNHHMPQVEGLKYNNTIYIPGECNLVSNLDKYILNSRLLQFATLLNSPQNDWDFWCMAIVIDKPIEVWW